MPPQGTQKEKKKSLFGTVAKSLANVNPIVSPLVNTASMVSSLGNSIFKKNTTPQQGFTPQSGLQSLPVYGPTQQSSSPKVSTPQTSIPVPSPAPQQTQTHQSEQSPIANIIKSNRNDDLVSRILDTYEQQFSFNPAERLQELRGESNIGALSKNKGIVDTQVNDVLAQLDQLESNVKARTGEFIVPDPARARITANERGELTKQLSPLLGLQSQLGNQISSEEENILQQLGLEQASNEQKFDIIKQLSDSGIISPGGGTSTGTGVSPEAQGYIDLVRSGKLTVNQALSQAPDDLASAIVQGLSSQQGVPEISKGQQLQLQQIGIIDSKVQDAFDALAKGGEFSAGVGSGIAKLFGGSPRVLETTLDTIKSSITRDTLQAMREASPTGGALGQVSDREINLLESAVASLDQRLDNKTLTKNLLEVKAHYTNIGNAIYAEQLGLLDVPTITPSDITKLLKNGDSPEEVLSFIDAFSQQFTQPQQQDNISQLFNSPNGQQLSIGDPNARLAQVNNNPGNLRFAGQNGASQGEGGFARFPSLEAGFEALVRQIQLDTRRGDTIETFVQDYAPSSENNTPKYIQDLSNLLGVPSTTPLSSIDPTKVARAVARLESGTKFT